MNPLRRHRPAYQLFPANRRWVPSVTWTTVPDNLRLPLVKIQRKIYGPWTYVAEILLFYYTPTRLGQYGMGQQQTYNRQHNLRHKAGDKLVPQEHHQQQKHKPGPLNAVHNLPQGLGRRRVQYP